MITKKFRTMCAVYEVFAQDYKQWYRFGDDAMLEMFHHETHGKPIEDGNGYQVGKKWLNVTVEMWREDIRKGNLSLLELYKDPKYPWPWLNSIFGYDGQDPLWKAFMQLALAQENIP